MSRMRWTGPRVVVPVALLAAGLAAISGRRVWLTGRVEDAVVGSSTVTGTGTQVVPGLVALALVLAAAVLAAATAGAVMRRLALVLGAVAGIALAVLAVRASSSGASLLGGLAAEASSRTGTIPVTGVSVGSWPWLVAAAAMAGATACLAGLAGASQWRGLSQRYDAPAAEPASAVPRGQRTTSAWNDLDDGVDPTQAPGTPPGDPL
ncbi:MAG TPA: Trp biosynthesis-associated membrane protein [Tetrasphaera sp.]|nr:Trp biosynthesis-associated membrane protein [Tetrasphaera sp.]